MRGLIQLQNTLAMIRENLNPDVDIEGILPTLVDTRTIHAKEAHRDPRGELRGPGVRVADQEDGPLRGGAGEGHVGAQVRPRRAGGRRLSPAGEGGALEWEAVSGRACGRARWPRCSARRTRTPSAPATPRAVARHGRRARAAATPRRPRAGRAAEHRAEPRVPDAAGAPAPRLLLRHAGQHHEPAVAPRRPPPEPERAARRGASVPPVGMPAAARGRRRRRRRQRGQPHGRGRGRRRRVRRASTPTCSRCSSPPPT